MARLSESDLKGLLAFLRTSESFPDVQSFRAGTLPALRELLPCDSVFYNEVDPVRRETSWRIEPESYEPAANREGFERYVHQHPLVAHNARVRDGKAVKLSDFLTRRELHRREIYHEVFRPLEIEYQMVITVPMPGSLLLGVPFNRFRQDFSERERRLLDVLRPHLVQAYRHAEARTSMQRLLEALEDPDGGAGGAVVLLTRSGGVQLATLRARTLLGSYFGANGGSRLPSRLAEWMGAQRAKSAAAAVPDPAGDLIVKGEAGSLRVTYLAGADGERDALLLEERPGPPSPSALAPLGLTPRQAEVLALAARGETDVQIGRRLEISSRTVDKHLEDTYRRLGVANRTAAVARAFEVGARR